MKICLIIPDEMLLSTNTLDKKIPVNKGKIQLGVEVPLLIRQPRDNSHNKTKEKDGTPDLCENQKRDGQHIITNKFVNWFCISGYCLKIVTAMRPHNFQFSQFQQVF